MKVKARPMYARATQDSKYLTLPEHVIERVWVEFYVGQNGDEGVNGSGVEFRWHDFSHMYGGRENTGLEITTFEDRGIRNLLDDRMRAVLEALDKERVKLDRRAGGDSSVAVSPERVCQLLEENGIPHDWHYDGRS